MSKAGRGVAAPLLLAELQPPLAAALSDIGLASESPNAQGAPDHRETPRGPAPAPKRPKTNVPEPTKSDVSFVRVGWWANTLVRADRETRRANERVGLALPRTKRARKDSIDEQYIGGMRHPAQSLLRLPRWERIGARLIIVLESIMDDLADAGAVGT